MDLKEITTRNYNATVKRGLIKDSTSIIDFTNKIAEEREELECSLYWNEVDNNWEFDESELADIILVCLAMAKHYDIDIQKELENKTVINETRKD